jgi:type IV secretory pathway VirB6-like protein
MEPDLLTLLLVLAMGTLGGTLHLARIFIDNTKASLGYFLYRPFLGAIAALVIFVVARTGIFVVAEPSSQNSGAPLSPFFISFVAIVSGLLAEQAIASIQGTGEKWFAGTLKDQTERYALRVSDEALKQKKDKAQLQKYAELDEDHLRALFDGSKKVPGHVQKVVSVWLRKPVRELFTELPPAAEAK